MESVYNLVAGMQTRLLLTENSLQSTILMQA
jgi:hypothetical protein